MSSRDAPAPFSPVARRRDGAAVRRGGFQSRGVRMVDRVAGRCAMLTDDLI